MTKKVFHSISCFKESPNFKKVNIILLMEKDWSWKVEDFCGQTFFLPAR